MVYEVEPSWAEAAPTLMPMLRSAMFGAFEGGSLLAKRSFLPYLGLFIGHDAKDRIGVATQETLTRWNQSFDSAAIRAFDNLHACVAQTEGAPDYAPYDTRSPYPIWHVTRGDAYESSRLALPGYLASFADKVEGKPIAIVPHRGQLVISGDAHAESVLRLAHLAEHEFQASPRAVSPALYSIGPDGGVVPYRAPPGHPQFSLLERGHYLLALACYAEQKRVLDARFEQLGEDVFVASFTVQANRDSGKLSSLCTMTQGVPALLPETDKVALVTPLGHQPLIVSYRELLSAAPSCFESVAELDPPRLRVVGWPTQTQLAELEQLGALESAHMRVV
jgi:hypothetical protein